jgi:agmatinase
MTRIALLGVPHDANSSYLRGAAEAPAAIRRELACDAYNAWTECGIDLNLPDRLVDCGDVAFGAGDDWDAIEAAASRALERGPLIALGGDHAITHPLLRAVHRKHAQLTIVHIDAHPDIYHDFQGNPRSHASPFARIMEEGLADRLIQIGLRTITDHQREQFRRFGVETIEAAQCSGEIEIALRGPVYLSLDLDGLDPAYAPGVSHREPGGLSTRQVLNLLHRIEQPLVGADIVEYNPRCDFGTFTATLAAKLTKEIAGAMWRTAPAISPGGGA